MLEEYLIVNGTTEKTPFVVPCECPVTNTLPERSTATCAKDVSSKAALPTRFVHSGTPEFEYATVAPTEPLFPTNTFPELTTAMALPPALLVHSGTPALEYLIVALPVTNTLPLLSTTMALGNS